MKKWHEALKLVDYLNIVAVSFVTFFVCYLLRNDYLSGDLLWEGVINYPIHFLFPIHGRFICGPLTNIICFANAFFDIHPMAFINTGGAFFRGIFYAGICYFLADSINIFEKKKHLTTPLVILSCFTITLFIQSIEFNTFTQFFGYSICLMFQFIACSLVIKHFVLKTKPENTTLSLWVNSLVALFMGQASYFGDITFLTILCLVGIYFLVNFGKETNWNTSEIISKFKQGGKTVYVPILVFLVSMGYTFLNVLIGLKYQNYQEVVSSSDFIQNSINFFGVFVKGYGIFLSNFITYFFVIAAFLILSFFMAKDKKSFTRFCYINLAILFSLLAFFFSLCVFGDTYYNGGCWLRHLGLTLQLHMTLLYLCVCNFGFLVYNLPFRKKRIFVEVFIVIAVFIATFFSCTNSKNYIKYVVVLERAKIAKEYRKSFYIFEKMAVTYNVKMKKAYLPQSRLKYFPKEYICDNEENQYKVFIDYEDYDDILKENDKHESLQLFNPYYYTEIYGIKNMLRVAFVPDEIAYKNFEEIGGTLTAEEVEKSDFMYLKRYVKQLMEQSQKSQDN